MQTSKEPLSCSCGMPSGPVSASLQSARYLAIPVAGFSIYLPSMTVDISMLNETRRARTRSLPDVQQDRIPGAQIEQFELVS